MVTTQLQAIIDLIPEPRAVQDLTAAALTQEARIAELEAALRKIEASCDGDDAGAMFNPRAACKVAVKAARAVLAKVG